jgi:hypothetical protein
MRYSSAQTCLIWERLPSLRKLSRSVASIFMDNTNPMNLKMFQERFARTKKFRLFPAQLPTQRHKMALYEDLGIEKNSIRIAPAWQLGDNDPDSAAIGPDDDPIIPIEVADAPVLRLLGRLKRGFPKYGR